MLKLVNVDPGKSLSIEDAVERWTDEEDLYLLATPGVDLSMITFVEVSKNQKRVHLTSIWPPTDVTRGTHWEPECCGDNPTSVEEVVREMIEEDWEVFLATPAEFGQELTRRIQDETGL